MYQPTKEKYELHNHSMTVLLELYPHWLSESLDLDEPIVSALMTMLPPKECLNKGSIVKGPKKDMREFAMMRNDGQFEGAASPVNGIDSFVMESWGFGYFVRGVIEGDIDVDMIPAFRMHMRDHWDIFVGVWAEKSEEEGADLGGYNPPDVYAQENALKGKETGKGKKGTKTGPRSSKSERHCKKFVKLMKELLAMKNDEIEQKFKDENITSEDLKGVVVKCLDQDLVEKVVLKHGENLDYWRSIWNEKVPFENPAGAKKLQSMATRAKSVTPKKRKRKGKDNNNEGSDSDDSEE